MMPQQAAPPANLCTSPASFSGFTEESEAIASCTSGTEARSRESISFAIFFCPAARLTAPAGSKRLLLASLLMKLPAAFPAMSSAGMAAADFESSSSVPFRAAFTISRRLSSSTGFVRKPFMPRSRRRRRSSGMARAVTAITGVSAFGPPPLLMAFMALTPSMTGICMSMRMRSSFLSPAIDTASSPEAAMTGSVTIAESMMLMSLRFAGLSSAASTLQGIRSAAGAFLSVPASFAGAAAA